MPNVKLTVAYDGTGYAGFQRQVGVVTVQAVLEDCLQDLTGERLSIVAAGRTDAGAHALGQVINFHTRSRIPVARFAPALNGLLPPDIAVLDAVEVEEGFHARRWAKSKTYLYRLWRSPVRSVFERNRAYHFPHPLDTSAIGAATSLLLGKHDFSCFCSAGSSAKTGTRTVYRADWQEQDRILAFSVTADGFLYRMVRNMVGTLIQVGLGKRPPDWVGELLVGKDRRAAGPSVPAGGLWLVRVEY